MNPWPQHLNEFLQFTTANVTNTAFVFIRRVHECGSGLFLLCMCLDLSCCGHHLHTAGRSLLCGIHRHHTADPHISGIGQCVPLNCVRVHMYVDVAYSM